jgi:hypothetical protein
MTRVNSAIRPFDDSTMCNSAITLLFKPKAYCQSPVASRQLP